MVSVEVLFIPESGTPVQHKLTVAEKSTVGEVLTESNIFTEYPELKNHEIGIFSERTSLESVVSDGDRIELYRPLTIDPKEKRRRIANSKK